jgi:aminoglycoside phosphotransferase (APT) family kinase protein
MDMMDADSDADAAPPPPGNGGGDLAARFLQYLRRAAQDASLAYAEGPSRIPGGFDTAISGFRLDGAAPPFAGPLVLRLFEATRDPRRVQREAAVQNALAALGYPAAPVVAVETDASALGGPFLVMARLPGQPLGLGLDTLGDARGSARLFRLLFGFAGALRRTVALWSEAQRALHALAAADFLRALEAQGQRGDDLSLDAHLAMMERASAEADLGGLAPGLAWLRAYCPPATVPGVVCHGDLHPLNILVAEGRVSGVVDWSSVAVAHPALDLGTALALAATTPIGAPRLLRPLFRLVLTGVARAFFRAYRRARPVDAIALRYFEVYFCVRQLLSVGLGRAAGRPVAAAYDRGDGVANLVAHIRARAGIVVSLRPLGARPEASTP